MAVAGAAVAQTRDYNVPAGSLKAALDSYAKQSGRQVLYRVKDLEGVRSQGVRGVADADDAMTRVLAGTPFVVRRDPSGALAVMRSETAPQGDAAVDRPEEAAAVEEIVVTAQKREQRLVDVPMSITAVSQDKINRAGIRSLLDLSRAAPGLVVTETGPGQNRVFMRGVANSYNSPSLVGVYVDEMPVPSLLTSQVDLQLVDLERVEVLRGPQGTLYGQGSAGGTIRLITKNPLLDGFSGNASIAAWTTEHGDPSFQFTGAVDLTVVPDKLGLRISGTLAELGGWIDQPDAGRENINNQDLRNVRVKALWRPLDDLSLSATMVVHRNHGEGITAGADANYDVYFPNGDPLAKERFIDNYELYNVVADYDFGWASLLSSTSYSHLRKQTDGLSQKLPQFGVETFNTVGQESRSFSQELRLSAFDERGLSWVLGAFFSSDDVKTDVHIKQYVNGVPADVFLPRHLRSKAISIFGDASYALNDRLTVGAGVRVFRDDRRSTVEGTFESVDPRFYLSYALSDQVKLYVNAAKGFRSGGVDADPAYGPETIWSYEAGTKGSVLGRRLRWEAAAFFSQYKDIQTFNLTSGVFGTISNAGDADIKGVDLAIAFDVTDRLLIEVSGNVTDAKIAETLPTALAQRPGDRVDFIPEYSFSLTSEYRFDWAASMPGFIRVDYSQIGPSTITDRTVGLIAVPCDTIGVLNARLGVDFGRVSAEFYGQNLLAEDGVQDPLGSIGVGSRPRPRVLGVRLAASF